MANPVEKPSKLRDQVAALAKAVEGIGPQATSEVNALAEHVEQEIARLQERSGMAVKNLADLQARTEMQLAEMQLQIDELRKAGGAQLSRPIELSATDIAELMKSEPSRRMIAVAAHPGLGLRAGDSFDPRTKFESPIHAGQCVRAGLRASAAPS